LVRKDVNDIETKSRGEQFASNSSRGMDFQQAVGRARTLLQSGDVERSLALLIELEKKYVRAVELFDLMGEVLLRLGDYEAGIRYKTLHEILRGTFRISGEERKAYEEALTGGFEPEVFAAPDAVPAEEPSHPPVAEQPELRKIEPEPGTVDSEESTEMDSPGSEGLFPVTAAMGHEFMRQGHFDRATEIFDLLLARKPENDAIRASRERAHKKSVEKQVVGVLRGWLGNIDKIRSELSHKR